MVRSRPAGPLDPASPERLLVAGYTDSTGAVGINLAIARDRSRAVADAIEGRLGEVVNLSVIWRGEEAFSAEPANGVLLANPRSRRVDVFHCVPGEEQSAAPDAP